MFTFKVETYEKNMIRLTQNESNFQILNIIGLDPPSAQINSSSNAGMDGAGFNSSKLNPRNLVITIKINGNIEDNRIFLYNCFRTKETCKIFYENGIRNVFIEGYVESFECNLFSQNEVAQISIICLDPYFKDLKMIIDDISKIKSCFYFPFSINVDEPIPISTIEMNRITNILNASESETGVIIEASFSNHVNDLEIRNIKTGERLKIIYPFIENDKLTINTNKGSKKIILLREGKEINLISYVVKGSSFFRLYIGDNFFSYLVDDGENDRFVSILFKHFNIYRGV